MMNHFKRLWLSIIKYFYIIKLELITDIQIDIGNQKDFDKLRILFHNMHFTPSMILQGAIGCFIDFQTNLREIEIDYYVYSNMEMETIILI